MADVTFIGFTQANYESGGSGSVAWPAGTLVGHLAILNIEGTQKTQRKPEADGWKHIDHTGATDSYCKVLTLDDITSDLEFTGYVAWLAVYGGAGRAYQVSETGHHVSPGGRVKTAGAYVHAFGRGFEHPLTPSSKLGVDVRNDALKKRRSNIWNKGPADAPGYLKVGSSNVKFSAGFEIVPLAGPSAPTLLSPIAGAEVDYAAACLLSWQHRSSQEMAQQARSVRIREAGDVTWLYLQADGTIGAAEAQVNGSTQAASIAAGELTLGSDYEWSARTEDADFWSDWSSAATFTAHAKPTVTSITVTAVAEDLSPTVDLTVTTTGAHIGTQVRFCPAADADASDPVFDSGILAGAVITATAEASEAWVNGQSLRAWVRVRQDGGLWSDWTADDATFAITWTAPAAPSAVTSTLPPDAPVQTTVTGIVGTAAWVHLQRSTDAGVSWSDVATVDPDGAASVMIQRPQVFGIPVLFRARQATLSEGIRLWSAWRVAGAPVSPVDPHAYLTAEDGSDWLQVRITGDDARTPVQDVSVIYPLSEDAEAPALVDRTPVRGWAGRTTIGTRTLAQRAELMAWLEAHPVWVWWWPAEWTQGGWEAEQPTAATLADVRALDRLALAPIGHRSLTIPWVTQ